MNEWKITFMLTGLSGRIIAAPYSGGPVSAASFQELIELLAERRPLEGIATIVGIVITRADIDEDSFEACELDSRETGPRRPHNI